MGKAWRALLGALALALLAGCGSPQSLEGLAWEMTSVQDGEGRVLACGPGLGDSFPGAQERELTCRAEDGRLTLAWEGGSAAGVLHRAEQGPGGSLCRLEVEGLGKGYAVRSATEYPGGESSPTLVVTFPGEYTFYFAGSEA